MQSFRTCHASQIIAVRVGQSAVAPGEPITDPDLETLKDRRAKLDTVDQLSLSEIERDKLAAEKADLDTQIAAFNSGDENEDGIPDETQDILHLVLTGGEKRSILREDLAFAPLVCARPQYAPFPPYAQRGPLPDRHGQTDQNSENSLQTANAIQTAAPVAEDDRPFPLVNDWLVEDYDILTDKFISKVYDNATFNRYFKASLN